MCYYEDVVKNLENYTELYTLLYDVLIVGEVVSFVIDNPIINLGSMFGYIKKENGNDKIILSNMIFETRISNYAISREKYSFERKGAPAQVLQRDADIC